MDLQNDGFSTLKTARENAMRRVALCILTASVLGGVVYQRQASGQVNTVKELAPGVTRAAVLREPGLTAAIAQFAALQAVAPSLRVELVPLNLRDAGDIERSVAEFARSSAGGLIVTSGPLVAGR